MILHANKMKTLTYHITVILSSVLFILSGCTPDWKEDMIPSPGTSNQHSNPSARDENEDTRKVLLLYSAGYNSLTSYLKNDIEDLAGGWLPKERRADDVLLVYSHLAQKRGDYTTPAAPSLVRLFINSDGDIVRDTLAVYETSTISSSASQLNNVLTYIKETFPAKSYGMVFSSHATGYLPSGFYSAPGDYVFSDIRKSFGINRSHQGPVPVRYVEINSDPLMPDVKSIGQDVNGDLSYEIDIRDFAEAIPMKLDYLLFDACLMGGVEVAYELADKCDRIGFSLTEVLAEGFNYRTLSTHLLGNRPQSDPVSVCRDYFEHYDSQSGDSRSATISLVDCSEIEPLAELCRELFEKYGTGLSQIRHNKVQRYFRSNYHWFYDLGSILKNAGAAEDDLDRLRAALEKCIVYHQFTPSFMGSFHITECCGLSMYLPVNGNSELDKYYRTLKWNMATGLVK